MKNWIFAVMLLGSPAAAGEWALSFDALSTVNRTARDVDVSVITFSTPKRELEDVEFGLQGGLFTASGEVTDDGVAFRSADANAVFFGGYARFEPGPEGAAFQPFVEAGLAIAATDRNLPAPLIPGDPQSRFYAKLDARVGARVAISDEYAVEGAVVINHISNATGRVPTNLNFDGTGVSIGFARRW